MGDSGSGKSDLALRLIDNGATLISDDVSICKKKFNDVYLFCPPETKGFIRGKRYRDCYCPICGTN